MGIFVGFVSFGVLNRDFSLVGMEMEKKTPSRILRGEDRG
jgi:hypothetical protein